MNVTRHRTDILILGTGGAGLFAALHAHRAAPDLDITVAVKGLFGKCGCTRMVQGGYNVAVAPGDSVERHFMDTVEGGHWLNDHDLAWLLVTKAIERIYELENDLGCFFDRNPDGSIHTKAFAGQTFDRTVHKGDLTGIEIMNRLAEQVWARGIRRLEEHRAVALVPAAAGGRIAGVLLIDIRSGEFRFVEAQAVLLATGGGPTMYRYHTPSGDKSCDGMAMALRAGLPLRDMEMVQFHPTGLMAGRDTRMTGTIIEEGLRGAGGHLLDNDGRRFMLDRDERAERATRDIVSRAMFEEMRAGRTGPNGGVFFTMRHLDADMVRAQFKGMVERCADCGFDLVAGLVEVVPSAHYMMGGVVFAPDCRTTIDGLFAAEDVFAATLVAGSLSIDATLGSDVPFDERINAIRGQPGQIDMAAAYRGLLDTSAIRKSHIDCDRVQDPYSLRCQPQVMGACLDHLRFAAGVFARELRGFAAHCPQARAGGLGREPDKGREPFENTRKIRESAGQGRDARRSAPEAVRHRLRRDFAPSRVVWGPSRLGAESFAGRVEPPARAPTHLAQIPT